MRGGRDGGKGKLRTSKEHPRNMLSTCLLLRYYSGDVPALPRPGRYGSSGGTSAQVKRSIPPSCHGHSRRVLRQKEFCAPLTLRPRPGFFCPADQTENSILPEPGLRHFGGVWGWNGPSGQHAGAPVCPPFVAGVKHPGWAAQRSEEACNHASEWEFSSPSSS